MRGGVWRWAGFLACGWLFEIQSQGQRRFAVASLARRVSFGKRSKRNQKICGWAACDLPALRRVPCDARLKRRSLNSLRGLKAAALRHTLPLFPLDPALLGGVNGNWLSRCLSPGGSLASLSLNFAFSGDDLPTLVFGRVAADHLGRRGHAQRLWPECYLGHDAKSPQLSTLVIAIDEAE